jgi:hypothetical protein
MNWRKDGPILGLQVGEINGDDVPDVVAVGAVYGLLREYRLRGDPVVMLEASEDGQRRHLGGFLDGRNLYLRVRLGDPPGRL